MSKTPTRDSTDDSVVVVVPANLRVIVANALFSRASDYSDHSNQYEGLTALATQIHELSVTGRAGHQKDLYTMVASATGVEREDVKKVLLALSYAGDYLAPINSNSPKTLAAMEAGKAISKAVGR